MVERPEKNIIEVLLDNAYQDTQVLLIDEQNGDDFSAERDVELLFRAEERRKADLVRSFIDDNRYGSAIVAEDDGKFLLRVTIRMPLTQPIICSVSALMACLGQFFGIEYDGWSSDLQRQG
jgi:hypothetical protein